jgi:CheY-like chemotaxis protein
MGGEIAVESEVGRGSCFNFTIEVQPSDRAVDQSLTVSQKIVGLLPGQPRYRILVVDDKLANRRLLVQLLSILELDIQEAENGEEAVQQWQTQHPHLIFMDLRMPVLDGYDATRRIRQLESQQLSQSAETVGLKQRTTIVAISATLTRKDQAFKAGCDQFIHKPLSEIEIFRTLQHSLQLRYRYQEESPASPPVVFAPQQLSIALKQLQPHLLTQLERAVTIGKADAIIEVAEEIAVTDPDLAQSLITLVNHFEYMQILEAIELTHPKS